MKSSAKREADDLRLENAIASVYINQVNNYKDFYQKNSYADLYNGFFHPELFSLLHGLLIDGLKDLIRKNSCKDGIIYVHADPSRRLICAIDSLSILKKAFVQSEYSFYIDGEYQSLFSEIREQLSNSYGSNIKDSENIRTCVIPYAIPVCKLDKQVKLPHIIHETTSLLLIGSGSYADVYKYHDAYYDKDFAVKQLKADQDSKTLERFINEYKTLKELNSPYVVDVFCFLSEENAFVMECMDGSIEQLCQKPSLQANLRNNIARQVCKSVRYLHRKGLCHRDIAAPNFLYKTYDDTIVVKMADLGIVKNPSLRISSSGTRVKGRFIDPEIERIGFDKFKLIHDLYPLSLLLAFIITGKFSGFEEEYPLINQMIYSAQHHSFTDVDELVLYCIEKGIIK